MTLPEKRIDPVSIQFNNTETPYSPIFDDVYYSMENGLAESIHVYLEGSGFTESLRKNQKKENFTIGEIGFGVGINFLLTFKHFIENSSEQQKITYLSAEKHPVKKEDLKKLYLQFPELVNFSTQLIDQYPILTPGIHTLYFANGRVKLILLLGDAEEMFSNLKFTPTQGIEFWYWDGFSPTKNPEMFKASLFEKLIPISTPGAIAASFTSAGWVRRGLEESGFKVEKRLGFGSKRECIRVYFPETKAKKLDKSPWFSAEKLKTLKKGDRVAVIGGGLSGTAIARAIANRGFKVTIIEQEVIAAQASGNPAGLYSFQLSRLPNPISRFSQLSLVHFIRELAAIKIKTQKGILRVDGLREKDNFNFALSTSEYPKDFFEFRENGVFFPACGIVNPKNLCEERSKHTGVNLLIAKVAQIEKSPIGFNLKNEKGAVISECEHVVYATGAALAINSEMNHPLLNELPIKPIRGQIIQISPTERSKNLDFTLQDTGYLTPISPEITGNETHCVGATYQAKTVLPNQEELDSTHLIQEIKRKYSELSNVNLSHLVSSRVSYRLSTPDKLPLIGPLCNPERLKELYSFALRTGSYRDLKPLEAEAGEWLFLGMSSRGITFSSYGSEILASQMCGEITPIEADLFEHLHPARFIVRNLKKPEAANKKLS